MSTYKVVRKEETKCFQQKYVYPGLEVWESLKNEIVSFLKSKKYMFNGGWAIHHFLKSLNKGLAIYDEEDICDSTDFDMFGPNPAEDLIELGEHLKLKFPELSFTVSNGMHPNQYVVIVNFMGVKLVDWIFVSQRVFRYLPSVTYKNGITCLHPIVELMRQYNMLSNMYLMAPDKDIGKALKRIALLEKLAFEPWMKEAKLWDLRKTRDFSAYPGKGYQQLMSTPNNNLPLDWQQRLIQEWTASQKYVAAVGQIGFVQLVDSLNKQKRSSSKSAKNVSSKRSSVVVSDKALQDAEYVVHDAVFSKCITSLIVFLKGLCKEYNIPFQSIDLVQYEPFIGVVGPLYNGWAEVKFKNVTILRLYSLATPVHIAGENSKYASYFFNMAHTMWRSLYLRYQGEESEAKFHDMMSATMYKLYVNHPDEPIFTLNLTKEAALGVNPVRNFYMMNNKLRMQKIGSFKHACGDKKKDVCKLDEKPEYFYNYYEGRIFSRTYLGKVISNKLPELPYLYERIKTTPKP